MLLKGTVSQDLLNVQDPKKQKVLSGLQAEPHLVGFVDAA
jgi:hypothetical protein